MAYAFQYRWFWVSENLEHGMMFHIQAVPKFCLPAAFQIKVRYNVHSLLYIDLTVTVECMR